MGRHESHPTGTAADVRKAPAFPLLPEILRLGQDVQSMLHSTIKGLVDRDAQTARSIWQRDSVVNKAHYEVSQHLLAMLEGTAAMTALQRDPTLLQHVTYLLWIAYKLERMADHCTNICESIVFVVEGETDIYATLARE